MRHICKLSALAGAILIVQTPVINSSVAVAQGYADMSCSQLWYARNRIYADAGYCFKTARARSQFGAGCFPPYGRLSGRAKNRVEAIKNWEARLGC